MISSDMILLRILTKSLHVFMYGLLICFIWNTGSCHRAQTGARMLYSNKDLNIFLIGFIKSYETAISIQHNIYQVRYIGKILSDKWLTTILKVVYLRSIRSSKQWMNYKEYGGMHISCSYLCTWDIERLCKKAAGHKLEYNPKQKDSKG